MQYKLIASILIDLAGLGLIRGLVPGWLQFSTVFITPLCVFLDQVRSSVHDRLLILQCFCWYLVPFCIHMFNVGHSGRFLSQYLYNRPVLTLVDMLEGTIPLVNLIPAATLGWAIEQGYVGKDFFKVRILPT